MQMHCLGKRQDEEDSEGIVAMLRALGEEPTITDDGIALDYEGHYDKHAMAIISVFESFDNDYTVTCTGGCF